MNALFELIDANPVHFALSLLVAYLTALAWIWGLCKAASRSRCECPACEAVASPDESQKILTVGTESLSSPNPEGEP